jgi:hypothetical protein
VPHHSVRLRAVACGSHPDAPARGVQQSDAYSAYDAPARCDGVTHVGCLDHALRKFVEAVKAQHAIAGTERGLAAEALLIIRRIYAVEKAAREARMTPEQRRALRSEAEQLIWDELRAWLDRNRSAAPPQSPTGKAIGYLADEWPRLVRYLEDGRLEVSNVLARMRSARLSSEERRGSSPTRPPARTPRPSSTASSRRRRPMASPLTTSSSAFSRCCRRPRRSPTSKPCCPGLDRRRKASPPEPTPVKRKANGSLSGAYD